MYVRGASTFISKLNKIGHYTTVGKKITYLPQNCKLSGNLLELEFCMMLGLSQVPCISVSLQGPTCHHDMPAISVYF